MQLFAITIATISLVQSAAIPPSSNDVVVSEQTIDETLAAIQIDDEQEPEWLIEFNQYMDNDDMDFDFDAFMSKMSEDEIDDFFSFFTMMVSEEVDFFELEENNNTEE